MTRRRIMDVLLVVRRSVRARSAKWFPAAAVESTLPVRFPSMRWSGQRGPAAQGRQSRSLVRPGSEVAALHVRPETALLVAPRFQRREPAALSPRPVQGQETEALVAPLLQSRVGRATPTAA